MKPSTRLNFILGLVLLGLALGFQNCAPAKFSQAVTDGQEKAAEDDVDAGAPTGDVVVDPDVGEVPIVKCPVKHNDCGDDHHGHISRDSRDDDEKERSIASNDLVSSLGQRLKGSRGKKDSKKRVDATEDERCVAICHLPSSDPAKAKTLYVGLNAVRAHVKNHGDSLGACEELNGEAP